MENAPNLNEVDNFVVQPKVPHSVIITGTPSTREKRHHISSICQDIENDHNDKLITSLKILNDIDKQSKSIVSTLNTCVKTYTDIDNATSDVSNIK